MLDGLVRGKQRGGADLAAEIADPLIPGQQLEHIVQRRAVEAMDIGLYQFPRCLPHPARANGVGEGEQQTNLIGQVPMLVVPSQIPEADRDVSQLFIDQWHIG